MIRFLVLSLTPIKASLILQRTLSASLTERLFGDRSRRTTLYIMDFRYGYDGQSSRSSRGFSDMMRAIETQVLTTAFGFNNSQHSQQQQFLAPTRPPPPDWSYVQSPPPPTASGPSTYSHDGNLTTPYPAPTTGNGASGGAYPYGQSQSREQRRPRSRYDNGTDPSSGQRRTPISRSSQRPDDSTASRPPQQPSQWRPARLANSSAQQSIPLSRLPAPFGAQDKQSDHVGVSPEGSQPSYSAQSTQYHSGGYERPPGMRYQSGGSPKTVSSSGQSFPLLCAHSSRALTMQAKRSRDRHAKRVAILGAAAMAHGGAFAKTLIVVLVVDVDGWTSASTRCRVSRVYLTILHSFRRRSTNTGPLCTVHSTLRC